MTTLEPIKKITTYLKGYVHHVALAPFLHDGERIETYQLLNDKGEAIASASFYNTICEKLLYCNWEHEEMILKWMSEISEEIKKQEISFV